MTILSIVLTILLFGALIAIHEFGHFLAAKSLGVRVNEFAIGMGPQLLSRTRGETTYSLRAFPIGGFCAMEGEEEDSDDPRSFSAKPAWKKFLILVAGPFMNFLAGFLIILLLFTVAGTPSLAVVTGFMSGAEDIAQTGLQPGDQFYRIDGHRIYFHSDALLYLSRAGETVEVVVLRGGRVVDLGAISLPYRTLTDEATGELVQKRGIYVGQAQEAGVLQVLSSAWYQSIDYVRMVWMSLGDLLTGAVGIGDMSGPIGIVAMAGEVGQAGAGVAGLYGGVVNILGFIALIAINLAVMNLLPIPALDGGRIFFLAVNGVFTLLTRRRLDPKYEGYINAAGFLCLLALMAVVAFNDIVKLIV